MDRHTLLLASCCGKAGLVTGLLRVLQNRPGVYSSSWVTLRILCRVTTAAEVSSWGLVVFSIFEHLSPFSPHKVPLQAGWTCDPLVLSLVSRRDSPWFPRIFFLKLESEWEVK